MGQKNKVRRGLWLKILLTLALMLLLTRVGALFRAPIYNDFVEYWAAARLFLSGGNPYSPTAMLVTEATTRVQRKRALLMWNPPWTLLFILPFGAMSYANASATWLLVNLGMVFACADSLWREYGGDPRCRWLGWLLAATFFPLLTALGLGQIGPLILLGLTLFLRHHSSHPFLAGAATLLIAVKPQLLYLFWVVLCLESVKRRRWNLLAGAGAALLVASLLPLLQTPNLWSDYLQLAASGEVLRNPSPNFGTLLRSMLGNYPWLQFVPPLFGLAWVALFWRVRRDSWEWTAHLPLVLLVSLVTTAYGWLFDQIVLLPALMQLAVPLSEKNGTRLRGIAAYMCVNVLMVLFIAWRKTGTAYTWTAPAWLLVYLWTRWKIGRQCHVQADADIY